MPRVSQLMPSAANLVAALCLAMLAVIVTPQVKALFPEGTYFGNFTQTNVIIGLVVGWFVMGKRAGNGMTAAVNNGVTGVLVAVFWATFVPSVKQMFTLATRHRYGGPFEALADIFRIAAEYGVMILVPNVLITLLVGAVLAGIITEIAARNWR